MLAMFVVGRAQCGLLGCAVIQQAAVKFRAGGGFTEMRRQKRALAAVTRV